MLPTHVGMNRNPLPAGQVRGYAPHTRGDELSNGGSSDPAFVGKLIRRQESLLANQKCGGRFNETQEGLVDRISFLAERRAILGAITGAGDDNRMRAMRETIKTR